MKRPTSPPASLREAFEAIVLDAHKTPPRIVYVTGSVLNEALAVHDYDASRGYVIARDGISEVSR